MLLVERDHKLHEGPYLGARFASRQVKWRGHAPTRQARN